MSWTIAQSGLDLGATTINTQITAGGIAGVAALADITFTLGGSAAGGSYVLATGSTSVPLVSRTGMVLTDLANTFFVGSTSSSALPVQMTTITASSIRSGARVEWTTSTETNCYGYDIERQPNGRHDWTKVGFVKGSGTSAVNHFYDFSDIGLPAGRYAYRIRQIDLDGSIQYSQNAEEEVGLVAKVLSLGPNYPNPFNPTTNIEFTVPVEGNVVLKVYNMLGQEVATLFAGEVMAGRLMTMIFDASRLPSGIYFSKMDYNGQSLVKRMTLMK